MQLANEEKNRRLEEVVAHHEDVVDELVKALLVREFSAVAGMEAPGAEESIARARAGLAAAYRAQSLAPVMKN